MNIIDQFGLDEENFIWQDLAMCHNIPTDVFFDYADERPAVDRAAKDICSYCPVQQVCLENKMREKAHGIHGGKRLQGGRIIE